MSEKNFLCGPWGDVSRLCCPDSVITDCDPLTPDTPATYKYSDSQFLDMASSILFRITCYRFPGICTETIRPCLRCICGCHECSCGQRYQPLPISLSYPLINLGEIIERGVVQDPANYRIDDYSRIVRLDDQAWPCCNNLAASDDTDADLWQITLDYGRSVPLELQYAAEKLACHLKKACNGASDCELPSHVRSVVRQGVAINVDNSYNYFNRGLTGVQEVDQILMAYPCTQNPTTATHPLLKRGFIVPNTGS